MPNRRKRSPQYLCKLSHRSPTRRSPARRSTRRSPARRSTRRSPARRSTRRSPARRSTRRSPTRRSTRRSPTRRSPTRRSPTRRSPTRRSPTRRSIRRSPTRRPPIQSIGYAFGPPPAYQPPAPPAYQPQSSVYRPPQLSVRQSPIYRPVQPLASERKPPEPSPPEPSPPEPSPPEPSPFDKLPPPKIGANIALRPKDQMHLKPNQDHLAKDILKYTPDLQPDGIQRLEFSKDAGWTLSSSLQWLKLQRMIKPLSYAIIGGIIFWYVYPCMTTENILYAVNATGVKLGELGLAGLKTGLTMVESGLEIVAPPIARATGSVIQVAAPPIARALYNVGSFSADTFVDLLALGVKEIAGRIYSAATESWAGAAYVVRNLTLFHIFLSWCDIRFSTNTNAYIIYPIIKFLYNWVVSKIPNPAVKGFLTIKGGNVKEVVTIPA